MVSNNTALLGHEARSSDPFQDDNVDYEPTNRNLRPQDCSDADIGEQYMGEQYMSTLIKTLSLFNLISSCKIGGGQHTPK